MKLVGKVVGHELKVVDKETGFEALQVKVEFKSQGLIDKPSKAVFLMEVPFGLEEFPLNAPVNLEVEVRQQKLALEGSAT